MVYRDNYDSMSVTLPEYILQLALEAAEQRGTVKATNEIAQLKSIMEEHRQDAHDLRKENADLHQKYTELYNKQTPVVVLTHELSDKLRAQPNKIHAIKMLRTELRPDLGLKDCKQIVDQVWTAMDSEQQEAIREDQIKSGAKCKHGIPLYTFCWDCDDAKKV